MFEDSYIIVNLIGREAMILVERRDGTSSFILFISGKTSITDIKVFSNKEAANKVLLEIKELLVLNSANLRVAPASKYFK